MASFRKETSDEPRTYLILPFFLHTFSIGCFKAECPNHLGSNSLKRNLFLPALDTFDPVSFCGFEGLPVLRSRAHTAGVPPGDLRSHLGLELRLSSSAQQGRASACVCGCLIWTPCLWLTPSVGNLSFFWSQGFQRTRSLAPLCEVPWWQVSDLPSHQPVAWTHCWFCVQLLWM